MIECLLRSVLMNSHDGVIHRSLEVKTVKCPVDRKKWSVASSHFQILFRMWFPNMYETVLEDAHTSRKQPNADDNIHGFVYMKYQHL